MQRNRHALALCGALALTAAAPAQDWRAEQIHDAKIEIEAPSRLERLPMQLGAESVFHRAKFRPKDRSDLVRGQYYWYCDVFEFKKNAGKDEQPEFPEGMSEEDKKKLLEILATVGRHQPKSFKEWLDDNKNVTIEQEGKPVRGKGGKLDYQHWVWTDKNDFGPVGVTYNEAAVYSFEDREVALVLEVPLETLKPPKPKSKWKGIIDRMIKSGAALDDDGGDDTDAKRDKYADTPERKTALEAAKANIQGLKGWDYFTQPNYVVLYSWDFEKPLERGKARKDAIFYSSRLEKMRDLYMSFYPLDETGAKAVMPDKNSIPSLSAPVTGAKEPEAEPKPEAETTEAETLGSATAGKLRYPVFRLCATYEQFQKYGQSPPGVVGWFSPASKELVVFLGGDRMMGQGATETVTYHEGWHQYADFYFDHPDTPKHTALHRWFDEGHGDYFGSFRWGSSGWKYVGSDMRYQDCKNMVRVGDYVPLKELVHWDRAHFYGPRASYYYAEAFSLIDFLRRGEKAHGYDQRWAQALDMYRRVMLCYGEPKRASDTAFFKFTDDDWKQLEEAWKSWVSGAQFLKG